MTFWNRKIVLVSTPTNKGSSRIEAAFEKVTSAGSGCRVLSVGGQVLTWAQVMGQAEDGSHRPETARYHCADCDAAWKDESRWAAISKGR